MKVLKGGVFHNEMNNWTIKKWYLLTNGIEHICILSILCYNFMNIYIFITNKMRVWLNGKISLCQGEDAGSIPATRHIRHMENESFMH
jgi:hypothetical protein